VRGRHSAAQRTGHAVGVTEQSPAESRGVGGTLVPSGRADHP
jgi:hypothetical protein